MRSIFVLLSACSAVAQATECQVADETTMLQARRSVQKRMKATDTQGLNARGLVKSLEHVANNFASMTTNDVNHALEQVETALAALPPAIQEQVGFLQDTINRASAAVEACHGDPGVVQRSPDFPNTVIIRNAEMRWGAHQLLFAEDNADAMDAVGAMRPDIVGQSFSWVIEQHPGTSHVTICNPHNGRCLFENDGTVGASALGAPGNQLWLNQLWMIAPGHQTALEVWHGRAADQHAALYTITHWASGMRLYSGMTGQGLTPGIERVWADQTWYIEDRAEKCRDPSYIGANGRWNGQPVGCVATEGSSAANQVALWEAAEAQAVLSATCEAELATAVAENAACILPLVQAGMEAAAMDLEAIAACKAVDTSLLLALPGSPPLQ